MDWTDTPRGRDRRERQAARPVPQQLPLLAPAQRALLRRWAGSDSPERRRSTLLAAIRGERIEDAEALSELLLREGWIARREQLVGGRWQWETLVWRELPRLQALLDVSSPRRRKDQRALQLAQAQDWLQARSDAVGADALDPDLLDELAAALAQLVQDTTLRPDLLAARLGLLRAVAAWHDDAAQGTRRDFALRAGGDTKALTQADWRWLESQFDLERLRIARFAPMLWLAGALRLQWQAQAVDLAPLHCLGLPLADVLRADAATGPARWWLIENRASFERQAQLRRPGLALAWLPGRPSLAWLQTMDRLLTLAPAPAWISADIDPAGVDIACTAGALWDQRGLDWVPHEMNASRLLDTAQHWPLNPHDHRLLDRLARRDTVPEALRALCDSMRQTGRKAEQEAWL
ncbi:hypothetical protein GCM10007320_22640 [Pseudorhodoferax aquiterrae]|uniref:Death domain-containing protein n=1 Tax=Pseudorhodoferax aquiterrae TaxID=747304 RepID=A0ABQ3G1Q1_9BURK|nr:DUF2399 domain-containing protein [Pseudorhodoferax aquiterrae]GHC80738.1 hypothetical protein GCM10007320_22640 [Pseudorhodoferax aquiterrae]